VVADLKTELRGTCVDVFCNGEKVYVVPKRLNKGQAVKRFLAYKKEDSSLAAGDSEFDIPMLQAAGTGFAPAGFRKAYSIAFEPEEMPEDLIFSDALLKRCLEMSNQTLERRCSV
jgi:phosphoserine phosphatase